VRAETETPPEQRVLWVEGRASQAALHAIAQPNSKFPGFQRPGRDLYFISFSYADLPRGKTFDIAFLEGHPATAFPGIVEIVAITQQFSMEWDEVPHGWKTICDLEFVPDVRHPLLQLPFVDGWYENKRRVGLCSRANLQVILDGTG